MNLVSKKDNDSCQSMNKTRLAPSLFHQLSQDVKNKAFAQDELPLQGLIMSHFDWADETDLGQVYFKINNILFHMLQRSKAYQVWRYLE